MGTEFPEFPCKRSKRRIVWVGRLENWQKCDVSVNPNAKNDPHNYGIEDGVIDIPQ